MYNARGFPITTPEMFKPRFPEQPVEGELYAGPNSFDFICETIRYAQQFFYIVIIPLHRIGDMKKWKNISFNIFDAPEQTQLTYEKRLRIIRYVTTPFNNLQYGEIEMLYMLLTV